MEKKEFAKFLNEIFKLKGFKKKANKWFLETEELIKVIALWKSNYGNIFYLDFGFIIKKVDLSDFHMHILHRLSSLDEKENQRINNLMDFDYKVSNIQRLEELKKYIEQKIITKMEIINAENDLLFELKKKPHLNNVPLVVKKHFNLL